MPEEYTLRPIAHIRSDFSDKFGIPRQSGLADGLESAVVFLPEYRVPEALRGLEGFSHLWLIWQFSRVAERRGDQPAWRPTVRPPRLGGNARMGVFATRSPYRPNALGLSCVAVSRIVPQAADGAMLFVRGADLLDGTPIYDIKPYLPYADSRPEARGGFAARPAELLPVDCPDALLARLPKEKQAGLLQVLAQDPRPAYQHDGRVYGMDFAGYRIRFCVKDGRLAVLSIDKMEKG